MMDQLGQVAAGFGILFGGLYGGWQARRANKHSGEASVAAQQAAQHAYPISNGWGTALRDDMAQQRKDTAAMARTLERIAEAQLLAERRESGRDDRLRAMDEKLTHHIENHGEARA